MQSSDFFVGAIRVPVGTQLGGVTVCPMTVAAAPQSGVNNIHVPPAHRRAGVCGHGGGCTVMVWWLHGHGVGCMVVVGVCGHSGVCGMVVAVW